MSDTAKMMEAAVEAGASDVLGMVLEQQARDRDFTTNALVEGYEATIARLEERLAVERRARLDMEARFDWLLYGGPFPGTEDRR